MARGLCDDSPAPPLSVEVHVQLVKKRSPQLSDCALHWKPPSPASISSQAGLEMGDEEEDWGSPAFISLQGLLPDCHLEVTPAGPGSPPPRLPFPWGQMSFLRQPQASASRPVGRRGLVGAGLA